MTVFGGRKSFSTRPCKFRPPNERLSSISNVRIDPSLRRQVETLLLEDGRSSGFLEAAVGGERPPADAPSLVAGAGLVLTRSWACWAWEAWARSIARKILT